MFRKLLSVLIASALLVMTSAAVFAAKEDDAAETSATKAPKANAATFTFDTDAGFSYLHTFGHAEDTGLTYELENKAAVQGRCLKLSQDFTENVSNRYGGIYFDAADFGLESFAGYTMTVKVKVPSAAAKATADMSLFTDGDEWIEERFTTSDASDWKEVKVTVPVDKANNKLGVTIPITNAFSGEILFLDDVTLSDNYGNAVANVGDEDTSLAEAPNTVVSVLTTILFVVVLIAVIGSIAYVILKMTRRYR